MYRKDTEEKAERKQQQQAAAHRFMMHQQSPPSSFHLLYGRMGHLFIRAFHHSQDLLHGSCDGTAKKPMISGVHCPDDTCKTVLDTGETRFIGSAVFPCVFNFVWHCVLLTLNRVYKYFNYKSFFYNINTKRPIFRRQPGVKTCPHRTVLDKWKKVCGFVSSSARRESSAFVSAGKGTVHTRESMV